MDHARRKEGALACNENEITDAACPIENTVTVVGAGICGVTLAVNLKNRGIRISPFSR